MEYTKLNNGEVVNKNNENKTGKKHLKTTKKKSKGKENIKGLITDHKYCERIAQRRNAKGFQMKDKRGIQGMFFKGLRTQFITRNTLNEVAEARKKEDINRIIDIGRFLYKKEGRRVSSRKVAYQLATSSQSGKAQKQSCLKDFIDNEKKFDCSLSPISRPSTRMNTDTSKMQVMRSFWRKKLNLKKELRSFSLKYEATVGALILRKLPPKGVLESALEALRQLEDPVRSEFSSSNAVAVKERMTFVFPEKNKESFRENFLSLANEGNFFEDFAEKELENEFIMNQSEAVNANHPSHLFTIYNDDEDKKENVIELQGKHFRKPIKNFDITTPPIHFYRRNMF